MKTIEVTAEGGIAVTGPVRLRLGWAQWQARQAVLGRVWRRGGDFTLGDGLEARFGAGERLAVDDPAALPEGGWRAVGWTPAAVKPAGKAKG